MGLYEETLIQHDYIEVREANVLPDDLDGVWLGDLILIKRNLPEKKKVEVLFEELAHHKLTYGDITNQKQFNNRKFENYARRYSYEKSMPLSGIVQAFEQGVHNLYELANFFEISEGHVLDCIEHYKAKYGLSTYHKGYVIKFDPLQVFKHIEFE
ncbi:ImmA/IrrE family metallo-endopeptidase [Mammaliicoccus sciuri]|uniref:ImmA/IrrE family metallo-endopeptidase n=1 Tax=Mammaliicoccus sciuri TaxID=1296 RepID=UPI0021D1D02F|nr:ImmA/IrrE family metallo-endopeptidase [Mammaliicoccus sciuri]UXU83337.1 ImmA/IrrE family metallo-endopeptidase [Mammaliicoccus sciuri]UXU93185.1 ImmA/IrrE family metallo-endopeptidase [Mammaliicoccus sciuri]UXV15134.1 ImmA/IrrE family metallo-endopeptidase [Mammaliicoccus sciuri]UXV23397.1 ImmA/IrrE family metallo-endopeptidase [Mammaliicoccus sciuri]UXV26176.1 ImmA/IrrE family metallo-endopeptidase [Mammaliicoccus sciuri]